MAENNSALVGVGAAGKVYVAPKGTALPTSAVGDLPGAYLNFGYVSEDGVTFADDDSTETLKSWFGPASMTKQILTEHKETCEFTPIEINEVVLKQLYGPNNVTVSTAGGYTEIVALHKGVTMPEVVVVVDAIPGDGMLSRYVMPVAQLTERGDISLTGTEIQGRSMTYTGNADNSGVTCYEYQVSGLDDES